MKIITIIKNSDNNINEVTTKTNYNTINVIIITSTK